MRVVGLIWFGRIRPASSLTAASAPLAVSFGRVDRDRVAGLDVANRLEHIEFVSQ